MNAEVSSSNLYQIIAERIEETVRVTAPETQALFVQALWNNPQAVREILAVEIYIEVRLFAIESRGLVAIADMPTVVEHVLGHLQKIFPNKFQVAVTS